MARQRTMGAIRETAGARGNLCGKQNLSFRRLLLEDLIDFAFNESRVSRNKSF
jgi:hypothetical protein